MITVEHWSFSAITTEGKTLATWGPIVIVHDNPKELSSDDKDRIRKDVVNHFLNPCLAVSNGYVIYKGVSGAGPHGMDLTVSPESVKGFSLELVSSKIFRRYDDLHSSGFDAQKSHGLYFADSDNIKDLQVVIERDKSTYDSLFRFDMD